MEYEYYRDAYLGEMIPREEWGFYAMRACEQLAQYERTYRVSGTDEEKKLAVCAMAEALCRFDDEERETTRAAVGSVSGSFAAGHRRDGKERRRELLRCAGVYLEICRAV